MSKRAWAYIWSIIFAAALLSVLAQPGAMQFVQQGPTFAALLILATAGQLFKARAPKHQSYHANILFFFAGALVLHPLLVVALVLIPHLVEWGLERWTNSPRLRQWYLQPFNISTHVISCLIARWVYVGLQANTAVLFSASSVFAATIAAFLYVMVNRMTIGMALVLARGVPLRESGVMEIENILTEFIMVCMGFVVAVLWTLNPWLILPALSSLLLIYRALAIPQLKEEARTDDKTGLWNARHFNKLFTGEMERAKRFDRTLSIIMADLDLLRNINNTYGHIAGDAVLAEVGLIIRMTIREYDIAGRFGGEEFCIALPETQTDEALAIAERIRESVANAAIPVPTSSTPVRATMSLGVASFPWDADAANQLIHQADLAVYQAKLKGRNCVVTSSDVPHSIKLETALVEDRLVAPYGASLSLTTRPEPAIREASAATASPSSPAGAGQPAAAKRITRNYPRGLLGVLVGGVIAAGILTSSIGFVVQPAPELATTILFVSLAVITQLPQVRNLYGESSMSVSVAVNFAAALLIGLPGVVLVSLAIVLAHRLTHLQSYKTLGPILYKTGFNWAMHVLAALAPITAVTLVPQPFEMPNLILFAVLCVVAALAYYAVETILLALAISIEKGQGLAHTWNEQFAWLAPHYVVLCLLGLILSVAYNGLSVVGIVVFTLPILMMYYAQKQYVERIEKSIAELKRLNEELTVANREIRGATRAIHQLNDELFVTLAKIIDARDPYVSGHSAKVSEYATATARELRLPSQRVEFVRQAGFLHDIGKIGISEQILHKPGELTPAEYEYVKTHVSLGVEFLEMCQGLRHLAPFVKYHHEWWDGRGYPNHLAGEAIPPEARILAVCDAVEAMASDRAYHRAMSLEEIIAEIKRCSGTQFEPTVAEAFVRVAQRFGNRLVVNSAREVVRKRNNHNHERKTEPEAEEPALSGTGWFISHIGLARFESANE